jgi:hypothetical protein
MSALSDRTAVLLPFALCRESAQRSRARKNDYMRQLEIENQGLKDEVMRLQNMLAGMQRGVCMQQPQMSPMMAM